MQYREAAVRISQTVLLVNREIGESIGRMFEYAKEGKITKEEANEYLEKAQSCIEKIMSDIGDPVFERYPDLIPKCCDCEGEPQSE